MSHRSVLLATVLLACNDSGLPIADAQSSVDAGVAGDLRGVTCEDIVALERSWVAAHEQCGVSSECAFYQARALVEDDCGVYVNVAALGAYIDSLNAAADAQRWCDPARRFPACKYLSRSPICRMGRCVDAF